MLHVTPASVDLAFQLAEGHWRAGDAPAAEDICRQIVEVAPDHRGALRLVGLSLCLREEWGEAAELLRKVVIATPHDAGLRFNFGRCLYGLERFHDASSEYQAAVDLKPTFSEAWNELGNALVKIGRLEQATQAFERAIHLRAGFAEAYSNLGMALRAAGKLVEACASYERAVALMPRGSASARVRNNIANLLRSMGEYDAAIDSYHEAIAMDAHYEEAYANLSVALFETGRLPEGVAACRSAMDLAKDDATKARMHENILYFLHFSETDPRILLQEHLNWNERWARPIPTSPIVRATPPTDRLKIGYVSPDFREHCQELFLRPLFANHDRSAVEIFCYSGVVHEDATTQWFRGQAHHWREIVGRADAEIIAMIRRDGIDVLVDLTMHLGGGRELMFARRGAPVQAAWLAYPSTTGLTAMDFRLTDSYLDPIVECRDELYSEKSVRLETFWCYDPNIAGIDVSPLPSTKTGFATFGCLNNFAKVTDAMLRLWGEVMRRVPSSRLILMAPKGSRRPEVLAALGVDPERVEFVLPVSRRNYLERYHRIDLCLDTFPCNGHTTSLDALWMGVPVVTLSGETAMSRGGMSVLTNAGLPHFVTQTPEQFVDVATAWAGNTTELSSIRSGLRQRLEQSILMNGKRFAQGMEHAFRNMCAELPEPAGA